MAVVSLHLKFNEAVPEAERRQLILHLSDRGAETVRPLFPQEEGPKLASLFVVECRDQESSDGILAYLEESELVEYAELVPTRRLIW